MYLRAGIHLVISPVSSSAVQTTATATYLITQDKSLHDHCQFTSFTSNFARRGRDSWGMCTDAKAISGGRSTATTALSMQDKLGSFSSFSTATRLKTGMMGRESSRNNNSPFYFLRNSVQPQGHQLHHHSGSSSIRFSSSYSRVFDRPNLVATNRNVLESISKSTSKVATNRQFSSSSSEGKDHNPGSKSGSNDGEGSGSGNPCVVTIKDGLETREAASEFLHQLSEHQKQLIYHTLNIEVLRDKYEGHLGSSSQESHFYLSKFGRPATAKEDPTGTLCEVSPKWLHARLDEKAPPASAAAIWAVTVKNALPFIGFGFLDNLIMILAGDYIDITIGTALGISTMAAAALGNAISDVAGIGSAWYVEELASKVGIKDPDLTPSQFASSAVRWACNFGRAFGVMIGCLLGMFPLLFLPTGDVKEGKEKKKAKHGDSQKDASDDKSKSE